MAKSIYNCEKKNQVNFNPSVNCQEGFFCCCCYSSGWLADRVRNGDQTEKNQLCAKFLKDQSIYRIKNNSSFEGIDTTCSVICQL